MGGKAKKARQKDSPLIAKPLPGAWRLARASMLGGLAAARQPAAKPAWLASAQRKVAPAAPQALGAPFSSLPQGLRR